MRRVLLASPIRLGCTSAYMKPYSEVLSWPPAGVVLKTMIVEGQPVNFARNEIASYACAEGFDDLVMVDDDMGWSYTDFVRLLSHPVDIVGGVYAQKRPGMPKWNVNLKEGCEMDEKTQICEVLSVGAGFFRVTGKVLATMREAMPWREYDTEDGTCFEFFPMGVVNRVLLGEDVYFCKLARECGYKVHADFTNHIPHIGPAPYPLT